jgi:hypothetical protein
VKRFIVLAAVLLTGILSSGTTFAQGTFLPPAPTVPDTPVQKLIAAFEQLMPEIGMQGRGHILGYAEVLARVPTPDSAAVLEHLEEAMAPLTAEERQALVAYLRGKVAECMPGIFGGVFSDKQGRPYTVPKCKP